MNPARLFIASLGNPAPLHKTRHSAGHVLLRALQSHLGLPALKKSKPYANGLVSLGADVGRPEYTLWHSPSFMNISGAGLLKAYRQFASMTNSGAGEGLPGLVILHDEMETAPGQLKVRHGPTSAKGHNGVKSVQQSLQSSGIMDKLTATGDGGRFIKIAIGIGRPGDGTRDRDDVSAYVLGPLSGAETAAIEKSAQGLVEILERENGRI
jgi:PTH1 family peptidyl-tRNA hydrolase